MGKSFLFIAIREPKKDGKGDQIILYQRIKAVLEDSNSVFLCTLSNSGKKRFEESDLRHQITVLNVGSYNLITALRSIIFSFKLPFQVSFYYNKKIHENIQKKIIDYEIDFTHNILIRTSKYHFPSSNQTIDLIDSMTLNFKRRLIDSNFFLNKIFKSEVKRLEIYEKKIPQLFEKCFLVSEIDNQFLNDKAIIIPVGVSIPKRIQVKNFNHKKTIIGFTGNMSYSPNIEAVNWFIDNVWSVFFSNDKKIEFRVIGRNPSNSLILKSKKYINVKIIGEVPNVYDYIYNNIDICVAPMKSGSGMQFKVVEGMINEAVVLLSSLAVGDIDIDHNIDCIICDTPKSYYESIINLIKDDKFRNKLILNAKKNMINNYSWKSIKLKFIQHFK